jgi:hypothetical protein
MKNYMILSLVLCLGASIHAGPKEDLIDHLDGYHNKMSNDIGRDFSSAKMLHELGRSRMKTMIDDSVQANPEDSGVRDVATKFENGAILVSKAAFDKEADTGIKAVNNDLDLEAGNIEDFKK